MPENRKLSRFIFLVRHASRERRWGHPEAKHEMAGWNKEARPESSDFESGGLKRTYALAGRLCDELRNLREEPESEKIVVTDIIHSKHLVARQTAEVFEKVLMDRSEREGVVYLRGGLTVQGCDELTPEKFRLENVIERIKDPTINGVEVGSKPACVVVGHQPHLTNIAKELLENALLPGDALPGGSLPLGNSEVACIRRDVKPRLLWLLTAKPKELLGELKDKVKSKYDVAKFFLGAFVVNTGLILNAGIWGNVGLGQNSHLMTTLLAGIGVISALASLAFTAATLFSYDRLMMPEGFWSESGDERRGKAKSPHAWSVLRPPSQAHVIIFYEMMHVWRCFFVPAIALAFFALVSVIFALAVSSASLPPLDGLSESSGTWWILSVVFVLSAVFAFAIPALLYQRWKPKLGSED